MRSIPKRGTFFFVIYIFVIVCLSFVLFYKLSHNHYLNNKINSFNGYNCISDSNIIVRLGDGNTIILLFDPECFHCENQIVNILINIDLVQNYNLIFISCQEINDIKEFSNKHKLYLNNKISIIKTDCGILSNNFHSDKFPTLFIFRNGKLIKRIENQIDIKNIKNYL